MKRFLLILLIALGAFAQGQNALTKMYSSELGVLPGDLVLNTGSITAIQFWNPVEKVLVGDPTMVTTETEDTNLYLGSTLPQGETSLIVRVGAKLHLFNIRISPDGTPRRYEVLAERPSPRLNDPLNPRTPAANLESDIALKILDVGQINAGETSIFFEFRNNSTGVVALDSARLRVTQEGEPLRVKVTKNPLTQLVEPGAVHRGYVVVTGVAPGATEFSWTVAELGGAGREIGFNEALLIPSSR